MTVTHSCEHLVHSSDLSASKWINLGALGGIRGGTCAHTGLFGDGFGGWGDDRVDHNALVRSI